MKTLLSLALVLLVSVAAVAAEFPAVNEPAPDFSLKSDQGKDTSLKDFHGKWVVLYFYPKDFTSGCTVEAHNFQRDLAQYEKAGAVILGVSVDTARAAIDWTRRQLDDAQRKFLERLPASIEEQGRLYVHASAHEPLQWHYILEAADARQSFAAAAAHQTFCGHVHVPALYQLAETGNIFEVTPPAAKAIPLLQTRRWLAVLGAVGQPRDRNPAACYGLLDERHNTLTYVRVAYDVGSAARKIREAGLPPMLAARLAQGY